MAILYLKSIPDDLKKQFKSVCAAEGKTMTEEIIRLMRKEVERQEKKKKD